jgi:arylsulfatase
MKTFLHVNISCKSLALAAVSLTIPAQSLAQWRMSSIKARPDTPNILWITTDQQRWDTVDALGNPYVNTPNIDRLVEEGVSFTHAFAQSPICTPSRASFMTGKYPSAIRSSKNGQAYWAEASPLISTILDDAGYDCALSGKFHLSTAMANLPEKRPLNDGYRLFWYSHSPYQGGTSNDYINWFLKRGVDVIALKNELGYVPAEYHQTVWCTDRAIDFIREDRGGSYPWMFSLNIYDPHSPLDPPKEYLDRYDIESLPGPRFIPEDIENKGVFNDVMFQSVPRVYTDYQARLEQAKYWAQIDLIDENVGRLMQVLEETGQLDNTLVIFTSDHGDMVGDHGLVRKGCRFYEGLVRVPLIFWYPSMVKQDLQSDALVELVDLFPTILDITGLPIPDGLHGKSLMPILTGEKDPDHHKDFVRSEFYDTIEARGNHNYSFGTMIRSERYKLVVYHGHPAGGELFDLENDPNEFYNLWDNSDYQGIRFELMKKMLDQTVFSIDTGPERVGRY